jgi:hypothetical protein
MCNTQFRNLIFSSSGLWLLALCSTLNLEVAGSFAVITERATVLIFLVLITSDLTYEGSDEPVWLCHSQDNVVLAMCVSNECRFKIPPNVRFVQ